MQREARICAAIAIAGLAGCGGGGHTTQPCVSRMVATWTGDHWEGELGSLSGATIHDVVCGEVVFQNTSPRAATVNAVPYAWTDWETLTEITRAACTELSLGELKSGERRTVTLPQRDYCTVCADATEFTPASCLKFWLCGPLGNGCPCSVPAPYC